MSYRTALRMIAVTVVALGGACPAETSTVEAITRPSADVMLKFTNPGLISKVLVKDGDQVKPGQVLVRLDDEAERAKLAQLRAQSDDETRIEAAQAQLDQKRLDLKKYEQAARERAATKMDVEHARLDALIAELSLKLTRFQQAQDKLKYQEALIRVDRMRLTSPIAGQVEGLVVEQGESVDALEDVLRIVKIDPLWVNVAVPMARARRLKKGDPVRVDFPDPSGTPKPVTGKIIHIPAEADAASRTIKVRVEVSNPTGRRAAGEHVKVTFGAEAGATAKRQTRTRTVRSGGIPMRPPLHRHRE